MARSVVFHGKVIVHPGAEAYVDLTGMVQPGVDLTQIAGIIAEAPNGQPGVLHIFADKQPATELFGAGSDAAEAVAQILTKSPDDNVPNAPALVYVYVPSKNRQAEYWLAADPIRNVAGGVIGGVYEFTTTGAAAIVGSTAAYVDIATPTGAITDQLNNLIIEVTTGWGKGQQRQIATSAETSVGSGTYRLNLRGDLNWDVAPFASGVTTKIRVLVPVIQLLSSEWGPRGNLNTLHHRPESSTDPNLGYKFTHKYDAIEEVRPANVGGTLLPTFTLRFDPTGGSVTPADWLRGQSGSKSITTFTGPASSPSVSTGTVLNGGSALGGAAEEAARFLVATGTARTANKTTINAFVSSTGASLSAGAAVPGDVLTGSVSGSTMTLISLAGGVVKVCQINGNINVGAGENLVGGSGTIAIAGGSTQVPASVGSAGLFTVGQTVTGAPSTATGVFIEETTAGGLVLANLTGTFADSDALTSATAAREGETPIGTATVADADYLNHIEIIGNMYKIASHTNTTATITAPGLGFSPGAGLTFKPMKLTAIELEVEGQDGVATSLSVRTKDANDSWPAGSPQPVYKTYDLATYNTVQALRDVINPDKWMTAAIGDGVAPNTSTSRFDFGEAADSWEKTASGRLPMSNLVYGHGVGTTYGQSALFSVVRDNVQKMVDWINQNHGRMSAARATGPGYSDSSFGYSKEIGGGEAVNQLSLFQMFYSGVSGQSQVRKQSSVSDPDYPLSWEHGFEQMLTQDDIRTEIPCASTDLTGWSTGDIETLLLDFQEHLREAFDARLYRNGYFGLSYPLEAGTYGGVTYSRGLLEWIKRLNDESISLCGQEVLDIKTTGLEGWLKPWALGLKTASIQLGTDLGEGFSLKRIGASNIRQPLGDWDPSDKLQSIKATLGGLLYAKKLRGTFRLARGSTTHVSTDNLARTDINVWEIRNHVVREMQIMLEDRFVGAGVGSPGEGIRFVAIASVASLKDAISSLLEEMRSDGIIIDSERNGTITKAYHSLRAAINGDIARVSVQVFPKTALNYVLVDFAFQLPVQSG